MRALVAAPLVFAAALVVQFVVWRYRRPAGQYSGLVVLYVAVLVVTAATFYAGGWVLPVTAFDYFNFALLYLALLAAYGVTYSAIQADSPTMTVLLQIDAAGTNGLARQELFGRLTDEVLVAPRLDDLVGGRLADLRRGRYVVAPRGLLMARTYMAFRRFMKMEKGG